MVKSDNQFEGRDFFQSIVREVSATMNLPASIWVLDEEAQALKIAAAVGLRPAYMEEAILKLDEPSVTGVAFETGEPLTVLDITRDSRWKYKDEAKEMGWKSALSIPLKLRGKVIGVISVYTFVERAFSSLEMELLGHYASQVEITLERDKEREILERLIQIGHSIEEMVAEKPALVLEEVVRGACEITGADCAVIYPYDSLRREFYDIGMVAAYGLREELLLTDKPRTTGGMADYVRREGEVIVNDIEQEDPEMLESPFIAREGVKAFMGVSLRVGEEAVGVIYIDFREPHMFSEEEKNTIRLFAHQAAIAIQNARLFEEVRNRADEVSLLQRISAQISAALELDEILPTLVEGAMRLTKTESGVVHVLDSSGENVVGSYGYPEEFRHPAPRISEQGYTRLIIEKGEQRAVPDTHVDKRANPEVVKKGVRSFVGTPLKLAGERVVGVLYLNDTTVRHFTKGELGLLRALADQAAVAIEHARLFQEFYERVTQLKQLQAVTATISAEPSNLERVSRLIVDSLSNIFHEASCAIRLYDSKTDRFRPQMATGVMKDWIDQLPRPDGTSRYVVQTKSPRYLEGDDVASPPDEGPAVREDILALGIKAVAYLPLISRGDVVGILYVNLTVPHRFSQDDKLLLELFADQAAIAIENTRLYQQRVQDISGLMEINSAISSQDPDKVIQLIADKAIELTGADYCVLRLLDRSGQYLIPEASSGRESKKDPLPIDGSSFTGWVASQRQAELCSDVNQDEHYLKWYPDVQSCMAAPLMYREELVGTLYVESTRLNAFSQASQLALLRSFADQAVIAIENARLFEEMERHASELAALYDTGREITSILGLDALLQSIAERSARLTNADKGLILLVDMEAEELKEAVGFGYAPGQIKSFTYQEVQDGISGWVLRERKPDISEDILADLRNTGLAREKAEEESDRGQSIAVAPLLIKDEVIGTLTVINNVGKPVFTNDDLGLVVMFANQAAIAIENARLYEQLGETVEQLKRKVGSLGAVSDVGRELTASIRLSESEVVELIYQQASRVMDTNNMYIALYDEATDTVWFPLAFLGGEPVDVETEEGWQPRQAGQGRTEWIIRHREPLTSNTRVESEAWYKDPDHKEYIGQPFASWIGVPMIVGEKVLGVIATYHATQEYIYDEDDLEVLSVMASQAAIALDNARLFRQLEQRVREVEALQELAEDLSKGLI